jgi:hypothetical protein
MLTIMKPFKILLSALLMTGVLTLAFLGCQKEAKKNPSVTSNAKGGSQSLNVYDPVQLTCAGSTQTSITLTVTAGNSGAPAGFSIQWMTKAAFDANGGVWPADTTTFCKASFSGVPYGASPAKSGGSTYNLATSGAHINIVIGDLIADELNDPLGYSTTVCDNGLLECGTQYVFRAFAHATSTKNRSAYTILSDGCPTSDCVDCTGNGIGHRGFGYWKEHFTSWSADSAYLTLGDKNYSYADCLTILNEQPMGNGLITLGHQLIAAKLNGLCSNLTGPANSVFIGKTIPLVPVTPIPKSDNASGTFILTSDVAGMVSTLHKHNNDCLDCPASPITN